MVIQHNLMAQIADNSNQKNVSNRKKSTEKLSTGYKINRSADNASGLSVSEKMRSQIRGLAQATNNSNDAISLIQTAEGGLQESEDIAQRMRELAVQAANGTYTDDDRQQIQYEIDALKSEVNRIAESTEFNEMKLLDGSNSGGSHCNTYGALYGIVAGQNAGSLAGAVLTSNREGVNVVTAPNASGKGGENAAWSTDGKTLTLNLTKGGVYSQADINELIKNASTSKSDQVEPADITLSFPSGVLAYDGDISNTGSTVAGVRSVGSGDLRRLISPVDDPASGQIDSADRITFTANTYGTPADTGYAHSIEIRLDVGAGEETVDVNDCEGYEGAKDLVLHLSTGVTYTESDLERLFSKAGFDYNVDLSDQVNPDGDSDEHIRFLQSADIPFTERVVTYKSEVRATEDELNDPPEGVEFFTWERGSVTTETGITAFLSGYRYFYEDTGEPVPTGEAADPSKTYMRTATNIRKVPLQPGEAYDPSLPYFKYVDKTDVIPPRLPEGSYKEVTSDTVPDPDKKYFVGDPGEYEEANTSNGFLNGIRYYYQNDQGRYVESYGQSYDPSKTYYTQKRAPSFIELDTSSGEFPPGTDLSGVYEEREVTVPAYGAWIEMLGGQGVGNSACNNSGNALIFQIGANGVEDQKLYVTIDDMSAGALGIDDCKVDPLEEALKSIDKLDGALAIVSAQRAKLGAVQNRLEHTTNSLNTANENLSAAESQIRDTDMAAEMVKYSKDNILQQASQSMLAQANQQPKSVLQLLG